MKSMKWIFGVIVAMIVCGSAVAQPLYLTVTRDEVNPSRMIFRWKGDGATQYRLWYDSVMPMNLSGLNYLDIDVTLPGYSACTPAVTPTSGFNYDYTYCYAFASNIEYFAITSVKSGGCVYGTITNASGNPLPGAAICFSRPSLPDTCVFANSVGEYSCCLLSAGEHTVNVSVACEAPQSGLVTVDAMTAVQYNYQLTNVPIVQKTGHITANETWTSNNIYQLFGQVIVDPGVVLTIQPGTRVIGSYPTVGVLILSAGPEDCSGPGGGIYAVGTPTNPIDINHVRHPPRKRFRW